MHGVAEPVDQDLEKARDLPAVDRRRQDDAVRLVHRLQDGRHVVIVRAVLLSPPDADGTAPALLESGAPEPEVLEHHGAASLHERPEPFGSTVRVPLPRAAHHHEDLRRPFHAQDCARAHLKPLIRVRRSGPSIAGRLHAVHERRVDLHDLHRSIRDDPDPLVPHRVPRRSAPLETKPSTFARYPPHSFRPSADPASRQRSRTSRQAPGSCRRFRPRGNRSRYSPSAELTGRGPWTGRDRLPSQAAAILRTPAGSFARDVAALRRDRHRGKREVLK